MDHLHDTPSIRWRWLIIAAATALSVLLAPTASATTTPADAAAPKLWALEVRSDATVATQHLSTAAASGINAIVADPTQLSSSQLAQARDASQSNGLLYIQPEDLDTGTAAVAVQTARRLCPADRPQWSLCPVITRRLSSALAVAGASAADMVILRVSSPWDIPPAWAVPGAGARIIVLVRMTGAAPPFFFDTVTWTSAIETALASPWYDLGVLPTGAAVNQTTASYLSLLSSELGPPPPAPDITPPSAPTGLVVTDRARTSVTIAWQPSTDSESGVAGYHTFLNGSPAGDAAATTTTFLGLECGTTYTLSVSAVDAVGNTSAEATTSEATLSCGVTANLWVDPDGGSCTRQAQAGEYVDAEACGTFQAALATAQPGDTVLVRCTGDAMSCTYPPEMLSGDPGGRVTIAPAPGESVSFEEDAGSGYSVFLNDLHHVTFQDIGYGHNDVPANLRISCSRDITLINSSGRRFNMFEGNADITFRGGDWGNYSGADEEDSTMGVSDTDHMQTCPGDSAPMPQTNILFDGVTWHDVFYTTSLDGCTGGPGGCAEWGASHPDCFEINGFVDGVTIQNSTFYHCGNTMLSLFTDQGDIDNVTARNNVFRDMAPTSYYGIQWVDTDTRYTCNNVKFLDNTYMPNAPDAWNTNAPPRFECRTTDSTTGTLVAGNTFQTGPPATDCATDTVAPYYTRWQDNTVLDGQSC